MSANQEIPLKKLSWKILLYHNFVPCQLHIHASVSFLLICPNDSRTAIQTRNSSLCTSFVPLFLRLPLFRYFLWHFRSSQRSLSGTAHPVWVQFQRNFTAFSVMSQYSTTVYLISNRYCNVYHLHIYMHECVCIYMPILSTVFAILCLMNC